jgi:hypothetical protein
VPYEDVGEAASNDEPGSTAAEPEPELPDRESGRTWTKAEANEVIAELGISEKDWVSDAADPDVNALVKWAQAPGAEYSIAMEWVGYVLGTAVGVPIPATYLEEYDSKPCSVQLRVPNQRDFDQARASPNLWAGIDNKDVWPLCVAFDLWLANYDRRPPNIAIQPVPADKLPAQATAGTTWLVDHGLCALWWPSKVDMGVGASHDVTDLEQSALPAVEAGDINDQATARLRDVMPVEYRRSFSDLDADRREPYLDPIRSISDDLVEAAIREVPNTYISDRARELTIAFLCARRDAIDTLSGDVFPPVSA